MIGYFFLLIALLLGLVKGFFGKKTSEYTHGFSDAIFANIVRMLVCTTIGGIIVLAADGPEALLPSVKLLLISALSGISTAMFVVMWLVCIKRSAYMMLDIFLMLGGLIPLIVSSIFFDENIKPTQWFGFCVLVIAVILMCAYNNSIKAKITLPTFLLLVVCGIANGIADSSQKLFVKIIPDGSAAAFNLYTYVFAAIILIISYAVVRKPATAPKVLNLKKISGYILIMGICLFANSYFKTLAAGYLSAVLLYPLNQGCALILSAVMSASLFKEKLTPKAVIGIITAFAGLLIINLL